MKVLVWTPGFGYRHGGVIVLHKLCHMLRKNGIDAYIWIGVGEPKTYYDETPVANFTINPTECAIIYPDIVVNNPVNAKYVIRWILNMPASFTTKTDLVVTFSEKFSMDCDILRLFEFWFDKFHDSNAKRNGTCFTVRKGGNKRIIPETDGALELSYDDCEDLDYVSSIFRSNKLFVSYDTATWLSAQAALCGCISVVVPDEDMSAAEWRQGLPYFKYGIAYGINDISYAKRTKHLIKGHLEAMNNEGLERFVSKLRKLE